MSARFFKIFTGVFLGHVIVLSLVWVGFSAPNPRPPAIFSYEGGLPAEDATSDEPVAWPKSSLLDQFMPDHPGSSYWTGLRGLKKP